MRRKDILLGSFAAISAGYIGLVGCDASGGADISQALGALSQAQSAPAAPGPYVVFGYNDLGMHCLNNDFSEMCILPPANTLRATVIQRGDDPRITTNGVQVTYSIPGNTSSYKKVNFWQYAKQLFGVSLANDVGLAGFGLSGKMQATTDRDFEAHFVPVTPVTDSGAYDPYQLASVKVTAGGKVVASAQPVIPVSWEMSCDKCHNTPGLSLASDILTKHDKLHKTNLMNQKPVLCARCHADPALGASGVAGISTLSSAMHTAHASRMGKLTSEQACYSCHPGPKTQCLRDVHKANGMTCVTCHTSMKAVGDPKRVPWKDEPRCGSCHHVAGHQYEQAGVLFRDSVGHNGVKCIACHGSPHAITPSLNARDNVQAIALQGKAGTISTCTVCHTQKPEDKFNHTRSD